MKLRSSDRTSANRTNPCPASSFAPTESQPAKEHKDSQISLQQAVFSVQQPQHQSAQLKGLQLTNQELDDENCPILTFARLSHPQPWRFNRANGVRPKASGNRPESCQQSRRAG